MYAVVRSEEQINELLDMVAGQIDKGGSKFPSMTYEEGLRDATDWLTGFSDDHPYKDEE